MVVKIIKRNPILDTMCLQIHPFGRRGSLITPQVPPQEYPLTAHLMEIIGFMLNNSIFREHKPPRAALLDNTHTTF
jgi:hypothetical protein